MITVDDIKDAKKRIAPYIRRTPLMQREMSAVLGTNVYLKLEVFQKTGSFKVRGAFNKMLSMNPKEIGQGVVAVSAGNHAQGVAYAAKILGIKSVILMPESTSKYSITATRAHGAEVLLTETMARAFEDAHNYVKKGWQFIHLFDDPAVIAGQGTIGLEILEDLPQVTDIIVSIGGGGLISGISIATKITHPKIRIWGVETIGADAMSQALTAGKVVTLPKITSIAKTLGVPEVSERTLTITKKYVENVTVVSDAETVQALEFLLERTKVLTEPAAACTLAAAIRLRSRFTPKSHVVLVLCGGNTSIEDLCRYRKDIL